SLAVNRQREFLADACAVEYTRDPNGLREALETLREDQHGSRLQLPAAQLAGHMFFAGTTTWQQLFQTHPALDQRIERLVLSANVRRARQPAAPPVDATRAASDPVHAV